MKDFNCFVLIVSLLLVVGVGAAQENQSESTKHNETLTRREKLILSNRRVPVTLSEKLLDICKTKTTTIEVIESLILEGADVLYRDDSGVSPLMSALYYIKEPTVIATLLHSGSEVNIATEFGRDSPLLAAAYGQQDSDVFELLLQANADINACNNRGKNVLSILMEEGKPTTELIFVLIDAGAYVQEISLYDEGWIPFLQAARNNPKLELIQKLHTAFVAGGKEEVNITPLMYALQIKTPLNVIEAMLEANEDVRATNGAMQDTPLHYAVRFSDTIDIIELLIKNGADLHAKNSFGSTPLHYAIASNRSTEIVQKLIDEGANVNEHRMFDGATPLMIASGESQDPNVLNVLLQAGADVHARNIKGQTALMQISCFEKVGGDLVAKRKKGILLEAGALMSDTCYQGKSITEYEEFNRQIAEKLKGIGVCGEIRGIYIREFE